MIRFLARPLSLKQDQRQGQNEGQTSHPAPQSHDSKEWTQGVIILKTRQTVKTQQTSVLKKLTHTRMPACLPTCLPVRYKLSRLRSTLANLLVGLPRMAKTVDEQCEIAHCWPSMSLHFPTHANPPPPAPHWPGPYDGQPVRTARACRKRCTDSREEAGGVSRPENGPIFQTRFSVPSSKSLSLPINGPIYGTDFLGWISGRIWGRFRGFILETSFRAHTTF